MTVTHRPLTKAGHCIFARMRTLKHVVANGRCPIAIACDRKDAIAMKIESSALQMSAAYSASKCLIFETTVTESAVNGTLQQAEKNSGKEEQTESGSLSMDEQAGLLNARQKSSLISISRPRKISPALGTQELKQRLVRHIIEMMNDLITGGKNVKRFKSRADYLTDSTVANQSNSRTYQYQTWYRSEQTSITYAEEETTTFDTMGIVKTEDGRELPFSLSLSMSRSFLQQTSASVFESTEVMVMRDPLVINLKTSTASISDQKFLFDIDCDGVRDEISSLGKGSGFLALDKNGDGIINDGSELFGTQSGNGFADLAAYDMDGNGWIDENDSIFSKLKVWTKDSEGKDVLLSLKEADVGAIFLGSVSTGFDMNDAETNDTNARIQSTGIYLHESTGEAGTVQHVDFAV